MFKKLIYIFTTLILAASLGYGAVSDIGTQTGQFLKLGAGARAAGMGEAYTAICEDTAAVYFNPAGLAGAGNYGVSLMHAIWVEGVSYEWVGWNYAIGGLGKFGLSAQYVSYGSIIETDSTGFETGSFTPSDLAVSLSYAKTFGGLDLGVTARYISLTIKQSSTAVTFDAGLMFRLIDQSETRLGVGIAATNINSGINLGTLSGPVASSYKMGLGYSPVKNILFSLDACLPSDNALYFAAGAEYTYNYGRDPEIRFRTGYNTRSSSSAGLSGFTVGLGFGDREYAVDYAYVPFGILGDAHRISFSLGFGRGDYSRFEPVAPPEIKKSFEVQEVKNTGKPLTESTLTGSTLTEKVKDLVAQKKEATVEKQTPVVAAAQKTAAPNGKVEKKIAAPKTEPKKAETPAEMNERIKKTLLKLKEAPKEQKPVTPEKKVSAAPVKVETPAEKNERIKSMLTKSKEEQKPVTRETVALSKAIVAEKVETPAEKNERIKRMLAKAKEEQKDLTAERESPKKETPVPEIKKDISRGETLEEKNKRIKELLNKKKSEDVVNAESDAPEKKETLEEKNDRIREQIRKSLSGNK